MQTEFRQCPQESLISIQAVVLEYISCKEGFISVRPPDVTLEAIRKLAREEGISLNEYICRCLKGKVERKPLEKRQSERFNAKVRDYSGIPMCSGRTIVVKESSVRLESVKPLLNVKSR